MPKIEAASVKEHRQLVLDRLVDAAEQIMRENPQAPLNAQSVAKLAGVARNSIYRYVESVNDLVSLVLARHLPPWLDAVAQRLAPLNDPGMRICEWVRANLEQGRKASHTWMMAVGNSVHLTPKTSAAIHKMHEGYEISLEDEWQKIGSRTPTIHATITRALLEAGFREIDFAEDSAAAIKPHLPVCPVEADRLSKIPHELSSELVIETTVATVAAIVASVKAMHDGTVPPGHDQLKRTGTCPVRHA